MSDKVAYVIVRVDAGVLFSFSALKQERDDFALVSILRDMPMSLPSIFATGFTGTTPIRHEVHTLLVPNSAEEAVEAGRSLRVRTSQECGTVMLSQRLAARGIASLSVGLPFAPSDVDGESLAMEIPRGLVHRKAHAEKLDLPTTTLGFMAGGVAKNPEIRCIMAVVDMRVDNESSGDSGDSGDTGDTGDSGEASEVEVEEGSMASEVDEKESQDVDGARRILRFLDAVHQATGATHVYAAIMGHRMGQAILLGPRAADLKNSFVSIPAGAGITLSLLGESVPADVIGGKILVETDEDRPASWAVDSVTLNPIDWDASAVRMTDGVATPKEITMMVNHLLGKLRCAVAEADFEKAILAAKELQAVRPSATNLLSLAIVQNQGSKIVDCLETVGRLEEEHPDSTESDVAQLIAAVGAEPTRIEEILDRHVFSDMPSFLSRRLWTRALVRMNRVDDAIDAGWKMISQNIATRKDRVIFAKLSMDRLQPGDAKRAAIVLRIIGVNPGLDAKGQPRPDPVILRARALHSSGMGKAAVSVLEGFLGYYPMEPRATAALRDIRSKLQSD